MFSVKYGLKMQGLSCCQVLSISPCYKVENRKVIFFCILAASGSKWYLRSALILCDLKTIAVSHFFGTSTEHFSFSYTRAVRKVSVRF